MGRSKDWIQIAGFALALAANGTGWTFEPQPPPPPSPPPERVVITRGSGSFLGIGVQEIDAERAKALSLREERGVEVTRVEDDSPASKGGIRTGDVVLEYNGQRVEGVEQFMRMVRETPPGREVKLSIARNGASQQVAVRTGARKSWMTSRYGESGAIEFPRVELPDMNLPEVPRAFMMWRNNVAGMEAESLDSQLAEYFGVKEGVLVRSVARGSSAEKAGLRAGDVVVKVDDTRVTSPREIASALRAARSAKTLPMQVIRDKRELTLQLPVEELDSSTNHALPRR